MRLLLAILVLVAVGSTAPCPAADEGEPQANADAAAEVEPEGSWLRRTIQRYFGRAPRSGEELAGRTEQLVTRYAAFAGHTIEVVIVYPVLRFDTDLDASSTVNWNTLTRLAKPLWSYTRESIIRQYLLFAPGDRVDPFRLADSERMIRQLEYMNDARVLVLPIEGGDGSVAVVVETKDRWPIGAAGKIHTEDRYDASIYSTNVAGVGLRFDNELLVHRQRSPDVGYRGSLRKQNIAATFVDARFAYEDSWRTLTREGGVERRPVHPAVRWVGGFTFEQTDDRDNGNVPRKYSRNEVWIGHALQVGVDDAFAAAARDARRRILTPAVSFDDVDFHRRPEVSRDSLRAYHERHTYLVGLTYEVRSDLKTSYLYRMGETEDIPDGIVLKATAGYEDGEYLRRSLGYVVASRVTAHPAGQITWFEVGCGGYLRERRFEDGLLALRAAGITTLLGQGRWRHRFFSQLSYLLGINRTADDIALGDRTGIRDLPNQQVVGDQRLTLRLESRVFTPWRIVGFDTMLFGYADVGAIGGESDPILQQKFYTSAGVGVRVHNADLVLPTVELRVGLVQNIADQGFSLSFDVGNLAYPEIRLPGVRPGGLAYE